MRRAFSLKTVIGMLSVCIFCTATVFGQSDEPQESPDTPPRESPTIPVKPTTPTKPKTPVKPTTPVKRAPPTPPMRPKPPGPEFPGSMLFNDRPAFLAGVRVNHGDLYYREGDHLAMEFMAEREAHLYLIYHQADGKSLLLFPNEVRTDNRIPAKQPVGIPGADEGFRFRVSPPFGTEVLQVLATLQPAAELDRLVAKTGRAAPVAPKVFATLDSRLQKDLASWTEQRLVIRTAAGVEGPPPSPKGERVGLFIGVSKFAVGEAGVRFKLGAQLMAKTMVERGRVNPEKAKTIVDQEASRANIQTAITRWLPSVSQPGDTVFIFYAGHGGTVKNLDGTKVDGRDGVLTTYDNNWESQKMSSDEWDNMARSRYISDDALARWLQELPGRQIALLICSCHAGTMVDARVLAKFASREAARVKGISQLNVAIIANAFPDEVSYSRRDKPVWLAQDLSEAMTKLPAPVTLRQAFEYYREEHRRRFAKDNNSGFHEFVYTDTALLPILLAP